MYRILFYSVLLISVVNCKTRNENNPDESASPTPENQSVNNTPNDFVLYPSPPVAGELLKVYFVEITESHVNNIGTISVVTLKDPNADYVRLWVCSYDNESNCNPASDNPITSTSGTFPLYTIPAKIMTVYAQACVDEKHAFNPARPCGQVESKAFVSSVYPLNGANATEILTSIENEGKKIEEECKNILAACEKFLGTKPTYSQLQTYAQNQVNIVDPQLCKQYMTDVPIPQENSRTINDGLAIVLGSGAVLALIAGTYGIFKLRYATNAQNSLQEVNANNQKLVTDIARIKIEVDQLRDQVKNAQSEDALNATILKTQQKVSDLEAQISSLKNNPDLVDLKGQLVTEQKKQTTLEQSRQFLSQSNKEREEQLAKENERLVELTQTQKMAQDAINKYTSLLNLQSNIENKRIDLEQARQNKSETPDKESIKSDLEKLDVKLSEFEANKNLLSEASANRLSDEKITETKAQIDKLSNLMYQGIEKNFTNLGYDQLKKAWEQYSEHNEPKISIEEYFAQIPFVEKEKYFLPVLKNVADANYWKNVSVGYLGYLNVVSKTESYLIDNRYPRIKPFTELLEARYRTVLPELEKALAANQERINLIATLTPKTKEEIGLDIDKKILVLKDQLENISAKSSHLDSTIQKMEAELVDLQSQLKAIPNESLASPDILKKINEAKEKRIQIGEQILQKTNQIELLGQIDIGKENAETITPQIQQAIEAQNLLNEQIGNLQSELPFLEGRLEVAQVNLDMLGPLIPSNTPTLSKSLTDKEKQLSALNQKKSSVEAQKTAAQDAPKNIQSGKTLMKAGFGSAVLFGIGSAGAGLGPSLGLVGTPESDLGDALDSSVQNIRKSRQTIDAYWQKLSVGP